MIKRREKEFLIGQHMTAGISKPAIRIEWVSEEKPLFPGQPFPVSSAWSESRYGVYGYQLPDYFSDEEAEK